MSKSLKITLIAVISILILAIAGTAVYVNNVLDNPNIYKGIKIQNINIGNLSKNDAQAKLKGKLDKGLENKEIKIIGDNYSKTLKYSELGVKNNYDEAVEKAYKVGREGTKIERLKEISDVKRRGKNINVEIIKNSNSVKEIVEGIADELYKEKKEATIKFSNGTFLVSEDEIGKSVDKEVLEKNLYESINNKDTVELPINLKKPKATKELLSKVNGEIGTYATKFKMEDSNRVFNIQRASNSIDNKLVMPGETFSFNSATGPRSLKAGYKEATVIMNGEFVPGEGGGVCQVSSTLYNTLLDSKISIVERHSHSLPISYVPPNKDATVAYNVLDLKFKNNYKSPVYIKSNVAGDTLIITLYGNTSEKQ